jgi:hypothetical protein
MRKGNAMNKKATRKLVLHRETVRHLTSADLGRAVGGMINLSRITQCDCPSYAIVCDDPVTMSQVQTECGGTHTYSYDGC